MCDNTPSPRRDWDNKTYFCNSCGRQMYEIHRGPTGDDQVSFAAKGLCRICYSRTRRKRKPVRTGPGFTSCLECGKPMSPQTSRVPGTIAHGSGGRCVNCLARARRREKYPDAGTHRVVDWSQPQECDGCGRPMRKSSAPPDGKSVAYFAHGMCRTCIRAINNPNAGKRLTPAAAAAAAPGLGQLLEQRRARKRAAAAQEVARNQARRQANTTRRTA